jgi:hypothetical protein
VLSGGSREVDRELVAADGDRRVQLELAAVGGLEDVGRLVAAVGEALDRAPDPALGVCEQLVHRGFDASVAIALAELLEATPGQPVGGELGA